MIEVFNLLIEQGPFVHREGAGGGHQKQAGFSLSYYRRGAQKYLGMLAKGL